VLAGRDPILEPVRIALEQRDRRGLRVEEADRGVDDRLQQLLLDRPCQAAGND